MAISPADIKRVKGEGFLLNRGTEEFSARIITENGVLTAAQMQNLSQAAHEFGNGNISFTTRLTVELPGIHYRDIEPFKAFVAREGMVTGGTGAKVRPVVACKGTTCVFGLYDTQQMAADIHHRFYVGYGSVALPHKFKIAVGGCPNNCVKPDLNDLGIIGQRVPEPDINKCRGCKVCQVEKACPIHAVSMKDGKAVIDTSACNHCGRCLEKCPFGAFTESTYGYKVYLGGRWGKKVAAGRPLNKIFTSEEEVIALVEKAILFFRDEGITGERFSDTITRLGFDYVEDKLLHGTINKEAVMEKTVVGGASC